VIVSLPDKARLTVDWLTPARSATSIDVTLRKGGLSLLFIVNRLSPMIDALTQPLHESDSEAFLV
jgi:hypothetical protein